MSTGTPNSGNVKVALVAADAAAGVVSLANPEGADLIVTRLVLDITTEATAACTLDAGTAATSILSDNLIDGLDAAAAAGVFDNGGSAGTNGKQVIRWESDGFLTISVASGASAGLVGNAYVEYVHV